MTGRPDPDFIQRRAADPKASVWVSASAGSGKTKVLTDRVLALLVSGAKPESLLCVTFTKAAAAEMANRIHARLSTWTRLSDADLTAAIRNLDGGTVTDAKRARARRLFAQVLDLPGGLRIRTIHSFCQSVLGRFPLEAGISPNFTALDDREASEAMTLARDTVLAAARGEPALADAVGLISTRVQEDDFARLLRGLAAQRTALMRALTRLGGLDGAIAALYQKLGADPKITEEAILAEAVAGIDEMGMRLAVDALRDYGGKGNAKRWQKLQAWLSGGTGTRAATFDQYFSALITGKGTPNTQMIVKALHEKAPAVPGIIEVEQERLVQIDRRLRRQVTARSSAALLRLGSAILDAYTLRKEATATLDYDDLIQKTAMLLSEDQVPWVLYKLDGGLSHLLIDEAQDTSPEQRAIVDSLVAEFFAGDAGHDERRTLFVVGDIKQSIFSFQGADPAGYRAWRGRLARLADGVGAEGLRPVDMQVSFRSVQAVLDAVDATFAEPPACTGVTEPGAMAHFASQRKLGLKGRVELWPPTVPPEQTEADLFLPPDEADAAAEADATQTLAEGLADTVARWIGSEPLTSEGRTVRAGDILFLVRSRTPLIDILVRELTRRHVPVAGVDRLMLSDEIAVMDLTALGRAVLMPRDDLTLACVLKSPLVGLTDDDLYTLTRRRDEGGRGLLRRLTAMRGEDPRFAAAADWFAAIRADADRLPPFELFQRVLVRPCPGPGLGARSIHTGRQALIARLGREIEDPLDEFLNQALDYDRRHVPSLEGFLAWFAGDNTDLKRDLEAEARDEVRIMTAHGAKGLQAPIVILPDALKKPDDRGAVLRWHGLEDGGALPIWTPRARYEEPVAADLKAAERQADDDEYRRLLYVAMTRAESRLIVTGRLPRQAPPKGNWYQLVTDGFERLNGVREEDFALPGGWQGIARIFETGDRDAEAADRPEPAPMTGDAAAPPWMTAPPPPEPSPPRPLAPSRPGTADPPVRSPLEEEEGLRFQRGKLIHRLLQTLPDLDPPERPTAAARYLALPAHGLTPGQQAAIRDEALGVLANPEFSAIFGPGSRAEAPLAGLLDGTEGPVAMTGQIDRLLIGRREILVVDYKTLRPAPADPAAVPAAYLAQMAGYRAILRQIFPDRPVRCALVFTETPRLVALPDAVLDRYVP